MTISILQRMTAWLCLAVALLTGVTPAQGFVLCLEPDGDVCFEIVASAERCGGCDYSEKPATTTEPPRSAAQPCCSCVDLVVSGEQREDRIQPKPTELPFGYWIHTPAAMFSQAVVVLSPAERAAPGAVPRSPDSLAMIRTVVLLV